MHLPVVIKHGAFSAMTLMPGEDAAAYEELHAQLVAELRPSGVLEEEIVSSVARLVWRRRNLATLRAAKLAQDRLWELKFEKLNAVSGQAERAEDVELDQARESAQAQAREELGDIYQLIEAENAATIDGLMQELTTQERLDAMIDKCMKRLLFLRGFKSMGHGSAPGALRIAGSPAGA
jgi:hypothetical protein